MAHTYVWLCILHKRSELHSSTSPTDWSTHHVDHLLSAPTHASLRSRIVFRMRQCSGMMLHATFRTVCSRFDGCHCAKAAGVTAALQHICLQHLPSIHTFLYAVSFDYTAIRSVYDTRSNGIYRALYYFIYLSCHYCFLLWGISATCHKLTGS
eukprot:6280571-Amphidinium_carterae.3